MKEQAVAKGQLHWELVQEKKVKLMEKDLMFEKEMIRRDMQRIHDIREHYRQDAGCTENDEGHGIGWFEKNLQRIGIDTSEHSGSTAAATAVKSLKELHDVMREKLPTSAQLQIESSKRMDKIRQTKKSTDVARKERERRQHRVHVEQQATQVAVEERKREEDLLAWLLTETQQYRKEAAGYELQRKRKEALWKQRESSQRAYAERAARESEEAYQRLKETARLERREQLAERKAEDERKKMRIAVGLGPPDSTTRENLEVSSDEEFDELAPQGSIGHGTQESTQRLASSLVQAESVEVDPAAAATIANSEELVSCVREVAVSEYLFNRGSWLSVQPTEAETRATVDRVLQRLGEFNVSADEAVPRLGSVVQSISKPRLATCVDANLPADWLPILSLTGSPAGLGEGRGKSQAMSFDIAQKLCQEFSYALIRPQEVINECIALAFRPPQEPDGGPSLNCLRQLGSDLLRAGSQEVTVAPTTIAEMIFRKIEVLSNPPPKPVEEEDPKAKKGKAKPKEEPPEPVRPQGIIILGFPVDLKQHAAWQAALRGYASPFLQLEESEENLQARVGTLLAPFWSASMASPLTALEDEKSDAVAAPAHLIRLQHPNQDYLTKAILKDAADESSWQVAPVADGEVKLTAYGQGFAQELAKSKCPVDRAWLFESAQVFENAFAQPLGSSCQNLQVEISEEADAAEACLSQIKGKITSWQQRKLPDEDLQKATEQELESEDGAKEEESALQQTIRDALLNEDLKEKLRTLWLKSLSAYLLGIKSILSEVDAEAAKFVTELVLLQRRFLDFLQRPDDKGLAVEDFLKTFTTKPPATQRQAEEIKSQVEELSDKLWLFASNRRQEAVEERENLMSGGFWEDIAAVNLRLAQRLQVLELMRFRTSAHILATVYRGDGEVVSTPFPHLEVPEGLSSLQEIASWLDSSAERLASVEASPDLDSAELLQAVVAERLGLTRRTRAISAWFYSRIETMRKQYEEAFLRMDDWIRSRVKEENESIRATSTLLLTPLPEEEDLLTQSLKSPLRRKSSQKTPSMGTIKNSAALRRRQAAQKVIVPHTLDIEIYTPPKLDVVPDAPSQGAAGRAVSRGGLNSRGSRTVAFSDRWTQEMLWGLFIRLSELGANATGGALSEDKLLQALLERRRAALSYETEQAAPTSWVKRNEDVLQLLCKSMVEPAWGAKAVDVTEFILALIYNENRLTWPSFEALEETRKFLEAEENAFDAERLQEYPDIPISEALFLKLPLWGAGPVPEDLKVWIYQVLACYDDEDSPVLPQRPGGKGPEALRELSARRLFLYFVLGIAPADGFHRLSRLLLPRSSFEASEDQPAAFRVKDMWTILYSQKGRPRKLVGTAPSLETFSLELWQEGQEPEAALAKAKAAPKAKGKGAVVEEEKPPPTPPKAEEATVALTEEALLLRPSVVRALCSHGGLLCRRRGLEALFTSASGGGACLTSTAAPTVELKSLLPSTDRELNPATS